VPIEFIVVGAISAVVMAVLVALSPGPRRTRRPAMHGVGVRHLP
jgi:hypothetical protein